MARPPIPGHGQGDEPDGQAGLTGKYRRGAPGASPSASPTGGPGASDGPGASGGQGASEGAPDTPASGPHAQDRGPGGSAGRPGSPGGRSADVMTSFADRGRAARLATFAGGGAGDRFPPGGWLAMLLDELSGPDRRCDGASDDELIGLLGRWAAIGSWADAAKLGVLAELVRRRARPGHQPRDPKGIPAAWEEGTGHEVAAALAMSLPAADNLLGLSVTLHTRLPRVYALLIGGIIDHLKAKAVAEETDVLNDALAAQAEALIVDDLAGKTPGQVRKMAAAAAIAVDPLGAQKRREQAEREDARVRFWREAAGTSALAGYGLPTDAALAANANINQRAKDYKRARLDGTMDQLRVLGFLDILNGISAADRIAKASAEAQAREAAQSREAAGSGQHGQHNGDPCRDTDGQDRAGRDTGSAQDADPASTGARSRPSDPGPAEGDSGDGLSGDRDPGIESKPGDSTDVTDVTDVTNDPDDTADPDVTADSRTSAAPAGSAPAAGTGPALTAAGNLTFPLETLLGLADRPGECHGLGPLDPALARDLAAAAARSPHSTWCVTITSPEGYAIGHGCARPARGKGGKAPPPGGNATWAFTRRDDPGPPDGWGTWTLTLPGGRHYTVKLGPIPVASCDHRHESHGYQPGDTLRHLVQVRDGECTFPPCSRHARDTDFEHAVPYDQGGRTCCCNAGARSRRCHRVKQSAGWTVSQPLPGWHRWTTPSGRGYVQGPKRYPA